MQQNSCISRCLFGRVHCGGWRRGELENQSDGLTAINHLADFLHPVRGFLLILRKVFCEIYWRILIATVVFFIAVTGYECHIILYISITEPPIVRFPFLHGRSMAQWIWSMMVFKNISGHEILTFPCRQVSQQKEQNNFFVGDCLSYRTESP
jgi:hypothetical protein